MPLESAIANTIVKHLKKLPRSRTYRNHGSAFSRRGRPDIEMHYQGRTVFFEVKQPGKDRTKMQEVEARKLKRAGCECYLVTSWAGVARSLWIEFEIKEPFV